MIAILVKKVTKYDCNDDHNGDLIWLQSKFQKGLHMIEIPVFKRTIYASMPGPDQNFVGPGQSGLVRISGPILFLVRSGGPEFLFFSRSGIPDQRTGPKFAGPEFRTYGPDQK